MTSRVCRCGLRLIAALCLVTAPMTAAAQSQAISEEARRQESTAAWQAAIEASTKGPATIPLLDEAHLRLPPNMIFVPPAPAARLLRALGNKVVADPVGLVIGTRTEDHWAIVLAFVKEGYIKDDDAKDWNADALLQSIREATEDANQDRIARGFDPVEVVGWITPPRYDATTHRLVSSLAKRPKGAAEGAVLGVNYDTYALGRDGYFALDMLTNQDNVEHDKPSAASVLDGLDYEAGHRYADFNASTDHVAAYGLAALVGAVAVKKLGLLAIAGAFALKFAKLGAIAVAGLGALATKLFRRKPKASGDAAA